MMPSRAYRSAFARATQAFCRGVPEKNDVPRVKDIVYAGR